MLDTGAVYARQRRDITAIVAGLAPGQELVAVPGCPDWRVRELLSHLAGLPADIAAGRVEGAGSEPWTAHQVEQRRDRTVGELLAEWAEHAPLVEQHATSWGPDFVRIGFDITLHGDDLREALGLPLGATADHAEVLDALLAGVAARLRAAGVPALRVVTPSRDVVLGDGEAVATLALDDGELARVVSGRRSNAAVRGLDWSADPAPWLAHLPLFGPKAD